ncbi:hypothetical protein NEI00_02640 [Brachyspira pilosicoli]|uniref:hypothetical protein n=1 Tax=Brachyspira pilosicoli TaxID=52584 RepID=UPI000E178311|nr:hypothetical protein [Brachyspira pilosicoli]WIH84092.1 hypothetical protein NEI00_02640 [Brachyspira pilosicoli]SUW07764.1 Uncharacterised protein [Brachyspira pilosicoli]
MIKDVFYFLFIIVSKTVIDLIRLFGNVIIFGFLLYFISYTTRRLFAKTLGSKAELYITGWIGTPIHEISHALFCIIFRHRIDDIKLFNTQSDTIGYVLHSYDSRSWYQQLGNFFIGIAPIIVGSFIVYILFIVLQPELKENIFNIPKINYSSKYGIFSFIYNEFFNIFNSIYYISKNIINNILLNSSLKQLSFWIFLYLSISIASHMELSPADISHAWKGVIVLFACILIINTFLILIKILFNIGIPKNVLIFINNCIDAYTLLLIFSFIISMFNMLISYIILTPINYIRNGYLLNPFSIR